MRVGRRKHRSVVSRPSIIVGVLVVVAFLAVAGGLAYDSNRAEANDYVSSYTPSQAAPVEQAPLVAIIGDSYTGGSSMGGFGLANWTEIVKSRMIDANTPIRISVSGQGGSGYVNPGTAGTVYPGEAARIVDPYDKVVVVFGSRNDTRQSIQAVRSAASATYSQIKSTAKHSELIVIGPAWTGERVPADILAIRDVLRQEANAAGALFVDPVAEGWFFGDDADLIGDDGVNPTNEGHKYLADRIQPHIASALAG